MKYTNRLSRRVFDNFWSLVEKWKASFITIVPTAAAELMQRPIDADVSSLKFALCGSAPLPQELFKKFETATGIKITEGYGMTESCGGSTITYVKDPLSGHVFGLPTEFKHVLGVPYCV